MSGHEHDWGTLIYGQCAYCPLTIEQHLIELHRKVEPQYKCGCGVLLTATTAERKTIECPYCHKQAVLKP